MKIIKHRQEAREALWKGVNKTADDIKITLGVSGRNAIIGRPYLFAEITNDGKTVAENYELEDEIENLGADKIREIAVSMYDKVYDGTTTAVTLSQAIFNAGYKKISSVNDFTNEKIDPIKVKKEIDEMCENITAELDKVSRPIKTYEDIHNVAMSSVKIPEYAKMIADTYTKIGKDGRITVEDGYYETENLITEGFEVEAGVESDFFNTNDSYTYENPLILITDIPLNFKEQIQGLTQKLYKENIRDLIIISDNFSKDIIQSFIEAKLTNSFNIIPIKAPYFGKKEKMIDVATALGTFLIDKNQYNDCNLVDKSMLGKANKIVIDKEKTIIYGISDVKERVDQLKEELKKTKNKFDKDQLEQRIAKLTGGIGVIRIASTESDRTYLKKKINNAINTTKLAMQEGVVKGGGLALKEIAENHLSYLTEALLSPYNTIQENCGGIEIGDDVIDAVLTTKTALKIASNLAGLLLTCEVAIADKREKPKDFEE